MNYMIDVENLSKEYKVLNHQTGVFGAVKDLFSKDYKHVKAVNDISFQIKEGEIVGYLGPNGAGKSTTIKMMSGILQPTSGKIEVNGCIPYKNRIKNSQDIGIVFGQRTQLWWNLPLIESYRVLKDIYRIDDATFKRNMESFDKLVGINELLSSPVRQLSLGQRTLADIVASFLHNPKVVFLDEPTIGLDVSMKNKIHLLIKELNEMYHTTVILTTHDMTDVEALCERIIIIDHGSKIYDDTYEKIYQLFGNIRSLQLKINENEEKTQQVLNGILAEYKNTGAVTGLIEDSWIKLDIDERKLMVKKVLTDSINKYSVDDIVIKNMEFENIIRKIYEVK